GGGGGGGGGGGAGSGGAAGRWLGPGAAVGACGRAGDGGLSNQKRAHVVYRVGAQPRTTSFGVGAPDE
ncbi:hypothetical protein AAHZ94_21370, partial [Streptomyces sp. HSW2009]|uniref:hypothetical protein n=1 Tax=Streptomyces sp. HSW2009 TaxID=3142890 RepID=UPI0032EF8E69